MNKTLLELLARVQMLAANGQEEAATYKADRVSNTVVVRVNPDLLNAQEQHLARARGAAELMLSGFAAYNRDMKKRYGTWEGDQATYNRAYDAAREQLESVINEAVPFNPDQPLQLGQNAPEAEAPAEAVVEATPPQGEAAPAPAETATPTQAQVTPAEQPQP